MNVPVPPIFLNEDSYGKYSVIDGKQRLIAINEFMEGRLILKGLEVFSDINGLSFDKLPSKLKQVLRTRPTVRSIIILRQSDSDVKYEVFQRLNTGGVSLNPQEIRNSVYGGSLNDLIQKLSENDKFHKLLGVVKKESSSIYKAMRDAEFVLRFFTFKNRWQKISGSMKRLMDEFMHKNRNASSKKLKELEREFLVTIEVVEKAFGKYSFKRWLPKYNRWRNQILASLYDAEMFACTRFSAEEVDGKQDYIVKQLKLLFEDDSFRESIEVGTNAPVRFRKRITNIIEMLSKIIGKTGFKKGL
ncbi:MAG: hypothetical protein A2Y62_10505 [Candidatus Fischerbacteria bacterium RBG_13_37_8]|uniref:GmrSD restriction endonucleases N-terminal domain-containing protein n=1 Tax=Candidatus Fischerbacteria bacterium RBG_13_37_8 TaxID=1817863 RepID=A0A1F5VR03_9BACT|nr:MAG: hypothetical protein A2Y62_10505 [Candidatus Fischerbacteria bacterium RBG_13_37_8]